jgi:hypothetical protein
VLKVSVNGVPAVLPSQLRFVLVRDALWIFMSAAVVVEVVAARRPNNQSVGFILSLIAVQTFSAIDKLLLFR